MAVYSDADAVPASRGRSRVRIGPAPARELSEDRRHPRAPADKAEAIHPGYGFLSERAPFARAVEEAGLIFVGPPASALEKMGSKVGARKLMTAAGVPVVPGETPDDQSDAALGAAANRIGFPVLIKPAAGGGGIGMKAVHHASGLTDALGAARREAKAAFGNDTLYVERLVERPRHVEIQVFADNHGHTVHVFERECSAQRRHQKVIEESPCAALSAAVRERMGAAAVAAAKAVGYRNAGTCEFARRRGRFGAVLFPGDEYPAPGQTPVTECAVGSAHAQRVASGEPPPFSQAGLSQRGHAINAAFTRRSGAGPPQAARSCSIGTARPGIRDSGRRGCTPVTTIRCSPK